MAKKKILFIIWSYTYGGGAEALLTMIANHLNPDKYDISIIEYQHADYKVEPVNDYVHVLPPVEKVETPDNQKKGYQVYHTPEVLIDRYIRGDYDLYVSFNYQIPTFLLPKETKNISWIHTDVYNLAGEEMAREWRLQDQAFDKAKKIVAISDQTLQSLHDLFPRHREKYVKIYNGLDRERVLEKSKESTEICLKRPAMMAVGRLDDRKYPERVFRIFSLAHQKNPRLHLYYVGEDVQKSGKRELLEEMIREAELGDYVHLLGYQQNPFPLIKQADVVTHFAKREGFGLVMAEAVALGVPIVAPDIGAAKALANHGKCGRIVVTDEEAADAVLELLEEEPEKIRQGCEESIRQFSLDAYIAQIEELFDSVIGG